MLHIEECLEPSLIVLDVSLFYRKVRAEYEISGEFVAFLVSHKINLTY
jgi:hypothetical protein